MLRIMAESERLMDEGKIPYVMAPGPDGVPERLAMTDDLMLDFGLKQGQTINTIIRDAILEANVKLLMKFLEEAEQAANNAIKDGNGYDYWIVKSYILLADVLVKQKDYFNAKATYESVFKNAIIIDLKNEAQQKYKQALTEALPLLQPVLIAKALEGDIPAIKEIHDRTMDKSKQPTDVTTNGKELPQPLLYALFDNNSDKENSEAKQED